MTGSRCVQSALSMTTPLRANASVTAGERSATRSLTRQVMHQAAVTLTKTGVPCARSSARRAGLNGSQPSPAVAAEPAVRAADPGLAIARRGRRPPRPAPARSPMPRDASASAVAREAWWSHAANAISTSPPSAAATPGGSGLLAHHPHEPRHRGIERKGQQLLEPRHPRPRARAASAATPGPASAADRAAPGPARAPRTRAAP